MFLGFKNFNPGSGTPLVTVILLRTFFFLDSQIGMPLLELFSAVRLDFHSQALIGLIFGKCYLM